MKPLPAVRRKRDALEDETGEEKGIFDRVTMPKFVVYESKEEGWLVGTLNGKTGLIPANYVEPLP
uniref:SH3 domain-containing protein n=1 Tax=Parascaris equorum TaxID=6256 RepID=A0A914RD71_PAREQ